MQQWTCPQMTLLDTLSLLEFSKCCWKAVPNKTIKEKQQQQQQLIEGNADKSDPWVERN